MTDYRSPPDSEQPPPSDQSPSAGRSPSADQSTGISGPPGGGIFSLEGRPAPGLYLTAWLLSGLGLAILFVAAQAQPPANLLLGLGAMVALAVGLSAGAGYQLLARRSRPPQAYRGPAPLLIFGIWFALINIGAAGLLALGFEGLDTPGAFLAGLVVQTFGYFAVIWLFVLRSGALSWRDMGVSGGLGKALGDAGFTVGVMIPVTLIALIGGGLVAQLLDAQPPSVVPTPQTTIELIAVAIAAAILAPLGEELFFRGFALTAWLRDLGARAAILRSSVFFAIIHINVALEPGDDVWVGARQALVILAVITPLSFVLGWLYVQRGLLAPTVGHITYNGILVALLAATQLA